MDISSVDDPVKRKALETMVKTYGQTPKMLFSNPHPGRFVGDESLARVDTATTSSEYLQLFIHRSSTFNCEVTIYLLTSCNTEKRIAQNIYIHNSNRIYTKLTTTTKLIKKKTDRHKL